VIGTVVAVDTEGRRHKDWNAMTGEEKRTDVEQAFAANSEVALPEDKWTKEWVVSHPWFQAERVLASSSSDAERTNQPYFRLPGAARVGLSLTKKDDDQHRHLSDFCKNWLRRSLINEMAWMRHQLQAGFTGPTGVTEPFDLTGVEDLLQPLAKADLDGLLDAGSPETFSVADFCSGASIDNLLAISAAIRSALRPKLPDPPEDLPEPPHAEERSGPTALKTIADWLASLDGKQDPRGDQFSPGERELLRPLIGPYQQPKIIEKFTEAVERFNTLPEDRRKVADTTLTRHQRDQILILSEIANSETARATENDKLAPLAQDYLKRREAAINTPRGSPVPPVGEAFDALGAAVRLIEPLTRASEDWRRPSLWARLTHIEAAGAIDRLEELQMVIESILSDEWANRGSGLRTKLDGDRRRPDHSLPVATIGPELNRAWQSKQGLDLWPDQRDDRYVWEFVARKKDS